MITLDSPPQRVEVPLPLDGAARDRSVRSQQRLLRLQRHLQHDQRRPELAGDQSRSVDAGSDPDHAVGRHRRRQPRPVRAGGGLRDRARRRSRRVSSGPAPTTARSGTRSDGGAKWNDVSKNITGMPAWGVVSKIEPSHFNGGDGVHRGRRAPDGQPRAVHLQDHRLRRDLEAGERRSAEQASAVVRQGGGGESEQAGDAVRRHRPRLLLLDRRRRALDRSVGRSAARAGQLGRRAEAVPRRRRVDLRPRPLRPRRHHAARAEHAGDDGRRRASVRAARRPTAGPSAGAR